MDNDSSDRTVELASGFDIKLVGSDSKSIGELRNIGRAEARGNIIAYLDADCSVEQGWLVNATTQINVGYDAVGGRPIIPNEANWVQKAWLPLKKRKCGDEKDGELIGASLICRSDAFDTVGGFSNDSLTGEDTDLSKRLKNSGFEICIDHKCDVMHWGYPDNLMGVFERQAWQAKGQVGSIFSISDRSIVVSVLWVVALVGVFLTALLGLWSLVLACLAVAILIPIYMTIKRFRGTGLKYTIQFGLQGILISCVYCLGRFWGVWASFWGRDVLRSYK